MRPVSPPQLRAHGVPDLGSLQLLPHVSVLPLTLIPPSCPPHLPSLCLRRMSRPAVSWRRWAWPSPVSQQGTLWNWGAETRGSTWGLFLPPLPQAPSLGGSQLFFLGHLTFLGRSCGSSPSFKHSLPPPSTFPSGGFRSRKAGKCDLDGGAKWLSFPSWEEPTLTPAILHPLSFIAVNI